MVSGSETGGGAAPGIAIPDEVAREARSEASTPDLLREFIDESRQLLRAEVDLVREEARRELQDARRSAVALGVTTMLALPGLTLLLAALAIACPHPVLALLILGGALVLGASVTFIYGYRKLPRNPLGAARARLTTNLQVLKEQVA